MSSADQQQVHMVLIGGYRGVALSTANELKGTPYQISAALDVMDSPDEYKYSAQNLGAVLHALHPRPRVLVTGTALERIVPEVRPVWEKYVEALRAESNDDKVLYVPVS